MFKRIFLFLLFISPLSLLQAQSKLPGNIFLRTLPNGLDVLVVEDNSVPLATINISFKTGSITNTQNTCGLNSLCIGMLMKNNKDYSDFFYNAGGLGIQHMNTLSSEESVNFYFTLPSLNLSEGLKFMNSALRNKATDTVELEKSKNIMVNQLLEKASNPSYAMYNAMLNHLWGDLYYRKRTSDPVVVKSATIASLDSLKNKYYYPNNALLIIAGDVEHDNVFALAEKVYSDWNSSNFDPFQQWPIPEFKPLFKPDYFIVESPLARMPSITIEWQGPDTRTDVASTYTADVFSYIVNQRSSKLNEALVQSGLAYSATIGYLTLKHVGPISLIITPNPEKIKECMEEVKRQLQIMDRDDYFNVAQIETAKRMLNIKKIREEEITSDFVHVLSFWWASASLNYFNGYNDKLNKVSKADLKNYVTKYIKNKPYCAGLLMSPDLKEKVNPDTFFKPNN